MLICILILTIFIQSIRRALIIVKGLKQRFNSQEPSSRDYRTRTRKEEELIKPKRSIKCQLNKIKKTKKENIKANKVRFNKCVKEYSSKTLKGAKVSRVQVTEVTLLFLKQDIVP